MMDFVCNEWCHSVLKIILFYMQALISELLDWK